MSYDDFVKLAKETREAQKRYFATRTAISLKSAMALEAKLDAEIKSYSLRQMELFENGGAR